MGAHPAVLRGSSGGMFCGGSRERGGDGGQLIWAVPAQVGALWVPALQSWGGGRRRCAVLSAPRRAASCAGQRLAAEDMDPATGDGASRRRVGGYVAIASLIGHHSDMTLCLCRFTSPR